MSIIETEIEKRPGIGFCIRFCIKYAAQAIFARRLAYTVETEAVSVGGIAVTEHLTFGIESGTIYILIYIGSYTI